MASAADNEGWILFADRAPDFGTWVELYDSETQGIDGPFVASYSFFEGLGRKYTAWRPA